MLITLDRTNTQPLYQQIVQQIQRRIQSGALPAGAKLPTVRELAQQLGVTRLTVHSAYSELQAGGWVEATVGRGTFVADRPEPQATAAMLGQELSAHGIINDMVRMAQLPGMRSLAMADAAPEFYSVREFQRALDEALQSGAAALSYTTSQGEPLPRTVLAELLRERGMRVSSAELIITSGVTQGLSLISRTLARPGDMIVVEQPTYLGALNVFGANGLRVVGVPVDEHGMVVDALEPILMAQQPRFIYTIPVFHNPTGACLSAERRAALLALSERYHVPIVEDDIYATLCYEGAPPPALQADDHHGLVLTVGSFSKSLLPGIRIGYVAAAPEYIHQLVASKQADDLCSPPLLQRALALFIQHGRLATHMRRVLPQYRARRDAMLDAMARCFPSNLSWTVPRGGFSTWVTLPAGISTTDLYLAAIEQNVAFALGDVFFAGPAPYPAMRLSFSAQSPELIEETVEVLGRLLSTHLHRRVFAPSLVKDYVPLV
jgi:DNA-binding transcriptional MocR family regulator